MSFLSKTRSLAALALAAAAAAGCNKDKLLSVTDPDLLSIGNYSTPDGADPLRYGVIAQFNTAFDGGGDAYTSMTGNLADEILSSDTFDSRLSINARRSAESNPDMSGTYTNMHKARAFAANAVLTISASAPLYPKYYIGQIYSYLGYTEVLFGEGWCPGVPLLSKEDGVTQDYGQSLTTQVTFETALAHFDSALALIDTTAGTATDKANAKPIYYAASVGKGRALLNLGRFDEAAAAVANVPQTFVLASSHSPNSTANGMWTATTNGASRYRLASGEGGNGLKFLDTLAADPRIQWKPSSPVRNGFSSNFDHQPDQLKFARYGDGIVANGIEAKLMVIEAQLQNAANDQAVFDALNALRASGPPVVPAMAAGDKPATHDGMVSLFFKERAFWLWLTGHRLGDLRRLVRTYGRPIESVFPTGSLGVPYLMDPNGSAPVSGDYGTSTAVAIPFQERNNPNFTGCKDGV